MLIPVVVTIPTRHKSRRQTRTHTQARTKRSLTELIVQNMHKTTFIAESFEVCVLQFTIAVNYKT